ncbi:hypothetical protein AAMO2058_000287400 [Amorphochlora amoebiformis]
MVALGVVSIVIALTQATPRLRPTSTSAASIHTHTLPRTNVLKLSASPRVSSSSLGLSRDFHGVSRGPQRISGGFHGVSRGIQRISGGLQRVSGDLQRGRVVSTRVASGEAVTGGGNRMKELINTLKIGSYFGLWYALNIVYNVYNKKALNALPLPWTMATAQLGIGFLYAATVWALRLRKPPPSLTKSNLDAWIPIAAAHAIGQVCTVCALGASTVSFVHIVKALEPFFSAMLSTLILAQSFAFPVYLSLVPVVGGVALACAKSLSFSWVSFLTAMGSNAAFALRAIYSKRALVGGQEGKSEKISAPNLFAVVTGLAFAALLPVALLVEGAKYKPMWEAAVQMTSPQDILFLSGVAGLFHYLNNEVMYLALDKVHPVTLAVGNTLKRVFILVASVIIFQTTMSPLSIIGASIAIPGTLVYSLTKNYYDAKSKKTA